jgi:ppGpp synthetase/RelA/SpoT-type nucleotidyltranferase
VQANPGGTVAKDKDLYNELRTRGVRKGTAAKVSKSLASRNGEERPKKAKRTVKDLRAAASAVEERMRMDEGQRASSRKAAKTRKQNAKRRSRGAKEMAAGR